MMDGWGEREKGCVLEEVGFCFGVVGVWGFRLRGAGGVGGNYSLSACLAQKGLWVLAASLTDVTQTETDGEKDGPMC